MARRRTSSTAPQSWDRRTTPRIAGTVEILDSVGNPVPVIDPTGGPDPLIEFFGAVETSGSRARLYVVYGPQLDLEGREIRPAGNKTVDGFEDIVVDEPGPGVITIRGTSERVPQTHSPEARKRTWRITRTTATDG